MEKQADVNMTFENFVSLYEKDIKPKLKLNTWLTKESIIKKILPYFAKRKLSEIMAKDIIDLQNEIRNLTDCHEKPLSKTYLKNGSQPAKRHFQSCNPILRPASQSGTEGGKYGN